MTENDLAEVNGLVARFYRSKQTSAPNSTLLAIQRRLLVLGVKLNTPVNLPDPNGPPGGRALKQKWAA